MFNKEYSVLATNILSLRIKNGLTQKQMAEILDIVPNNYRIKESNKDEGRRFNLNHVLKLCKIFDLTPNDLLLKQEGMNYDN